MSGRARRLAATLRANEALYIVAAATASTQMVWGVVVPVLPAFTREFGVTAAQFGLVVAMFGLGRLIVNIPAGALSERLDRRRLLPLSILGVVLFSTVSGFATSYEQLLVLRLLTGVAGGVAITTGQALIGDLTEPASRGRVMATLQAFQLIGGSLGPAVGGIVASLWGLRAPFWASGVVATVVLVWALARLRRAARPVTGDAAGRTELTTGTVGGLVRDRSFLAVCLVGFAVFFQRFAGMQFLVPLIAFALAGMDVRDLGLVLGAVTLVNVFSVRLAGRLSDRHGRKRVIVPSLAAVAVGVLTYLLTDSAAWFVFATLFTGAASGFGGPTPGAYLMDVAPASRRGTAVGIYRTFGDLAGLVGPVALGWVVDLAGYHAAIVALAAVTAAAATAFGLLARETVGPRAAADGPQPPAAAPRGGRGRALVVALVAVAVVAGMVTAGVLLAG